MDNSRSGNSEKMAVVTYDADDLINTYELAPGSQIIGILDKSGGVDSKDRNLLME